MARRTVREILSDWKLLDDRSASQTVARRGARLGFAGQLAAFISTGAIVAVVVVAVLSARGPFAERLPPGAFGPTPTQQARLTPPSLPQAATPAPSTLPIPSLPIVSSIPSPSAADKAAARTAVDRYTRALVVGDYAAAWAMLGAVTTPTPPAEWSAERRAFFNSVGGDYEVTVDPTDVAPILAWLGNPGLQGADLTRAVLVEVTYPRIAQFNQFDLYVVVVGSTGPIIFGVR
jgi:hypothetical protein